MLHSSEAASSSSCVEPVGREERRGEERRGEWAGGTKPEIDRHELGVGAGNQCTSIQGVGWDEVVPHICGFKPS
jgi:hypothetical protein